MTKNLARTRNFRCRTKFSGYRGNHRNNLDINISTDKNELTYIQISNPPSRLYIYEGYKKCFLDPDMALKYYKSPTIYSFNNFPIIIASQTLCGNSYNF